MSCHTKSLMPLLPQYCDANLQPLASLVLYFCAQLQLTQQLDPAMQVERPWIALEDIKSFNIQAESPVHQKQVSGMTAVVFTRRLALVIIYNRLQIKWVALEVSNNPKNVWP